MDEGWNLFRPTNQVILDIKLVFKNKFAAHAYKNPWPMCLCYQFILVLYLCKGMTSWWFENVEGALF